jgi:hypothetical protein
MGVCLDKDKEIHVDTKIFNPLPIIEAEMEKLEEVNEEKIEIEVEDNEHLETEIDA